MFKIQPEPTFWVDVEVKTPNGAEKFKMKFKHLDVIEFSEWVNRASHLDTDDMKKLVADQVGLFMEVCESWDVPDTEFNKENMHAAVKNYIGVGGAIINAYSEGYLGAQVKN